jgi:hypothetical protein
MNAKKKRRKLQQEPSYTFTPAQLQMREDLIGGASTAFAKKLDMQLLQAQAEVEAKAKPGEPTPLKDVLDNIWTPPAEVGLKPEAKAVEEVALEVIDVHGVGLSLNFYQWAQVQGLVQAGIRAGIQIGRDSVG